jgi:hypothetical protein
MFEAGTPIAAHRKEIRAGLVSLAAPVIVIGGWALVAPRNWYDNFPTDSANWISSLGAFQEHLVRDFGSLYLALGLLLLFAAIVLDRLLVQAVLGASLVFQVPHLIFHAANTEPLSTASNAVNLVLLGVGLLVTVVLLGMSTRPVARTATEVKPVEGGIGYGTR